MDEKGISSVDEKEEDTSGRSFDCGVRSQVQAITGTVLISKIL